MAIEKLPVDFKDDIIDVSVTDKRRYHIITNSDGTVSLNDVTTYLQNGSQFGSEQIIQANEAVNEIIDNLGNLETLETKDKTNLVRGINEITKNIGDMETLTTDDKLNIVNAVNEVISDIGNIKTLTTDDKSNIVNAVNEISSGWSNAIKNYLPLTGGTIEGDWLPLKIKRKTADTQGLLFQNSTGDLVELQATNEGTFKIWSNKLFKEIFTVKSDGCYSYGTKLLTKDETEFILANQQSLSFTNKVCTITNSKITANSLADVYFTSDTIEHAGECNIKVESLAGQIKLTAEKQPTFEIKATIKIRVV